EFNNNVIDVIGQPVVIPYITELGNQSNYTPDFLVQFSISNCDDFEDFPVPMIIEIKHKKKLAEYWDNLKPKFRAAHRFASDKGWKFKIISEKILYD
ncbi:TnsA endonuclease N-terminal domain-containing protein, partial [Acinetobacter baumannii]|uniref:TnsA endonuclease N-terminal domain-containing protein n=1 Tax=Acinetobacter baumannii TaxID=470 RepID=UPI00148EF327